MVWTDVAEADDYVVFSGIDPTTIFNDAVGVSTSGVTGLSSPVPAGPLVFYRVAGRNAVCGVGPQK